MRTAQHTYDAEKAAMMPIYEEHGFANREAYLDHLVANTGVEPDVVHMVGVAQRMHPAGVADAGLVFGALVDARGRLTAHRAVEGSGGEQPVLGSVTAPVLAPLLQQPGRARDGVTPVSWTHLGFRHQH